MEVLLRLLVASMLLQLLGLLMVAPATMLPTEVTKLSVLVRVFGQTTSDTPWVAEEGAANVLEVVKIKLL